MDLSLRTKNYAQGDQSWLGSVHGTNMCRTITLDTSAFTAGTHYPDGFFKSGLPLGVITASGMYGPYDDAAVDGRAVLRGFLYAAVDAPDVNTADVQGALYEHGRVVEAKLPIAIDAAGRTDLAGRV